MSVAMLASPCPRRETLTVGVRAMWAGMLPQCYGVFQRWKGPATRLVARTSPRGPSCRRRSWRSRLRSDDPVGEHSDLLDLGFHAIPGLQVVAGGRAHAIGRAGGDDVAGQERHGLREHLDALVDGEDHLAGVARLTDLAVDTHGDVEGLRIGQLVGGDEHGAHGTERVQRLALEPLRVPLLQVARRHVVDDGVAEDVPEGIRAADVAPARPDHRGQLHLVVELTRHRVVHDVVAGTHHRRAWLREVHGMLGDGGAALRRVIRIIAPETEDVARRLGNGGEQPHPLEGVREPALGQLLDGMLRHERLAVLPGLAGQSERGLAALNHLEEALRKAAAAAPDSAALHGQVLREPAQIEDGVIPNSAGLGLSPTPTEGDEAHGYWLK